MRPRAIDLRVLIICTLLTALVAGSAHAGTIASRVLGQPDFLHGGANTVDASSFAFNISENLHIAIAVDSAGHLYLGDSLNNRVLGWHSVSALVTGEPADLVIGQPDFETSSAAANTSASTLVGPRGLGVDTAGNLYVADTGESRVLIFPDPFTTMSHTGQTAGFSATAVIGQVGNFTSSACNISGGPSPDTLCSPEDVAVDTAGNVYIVDTGNNRVVEYNGPVTSSPIGANQVFGQLGNFFTGGANAGGSISKDGLKDPTGLAIDQHNNLYVADLGNNRLLEFNTPLTVTLITGSGDTSADEVWGQGGSFTTGSCNSVSATSLCSPIKVALDASANLYIGDAGNNRVLEYNEGANPPVNQTANRFIGQTSATGHAINQGGATPNATTLNFPSGVALDSAGDLFVADGNNNRVLKYQSPLSTDQSASVALGEPDFTHTANVIDPASLGGPQQIAIDPSTGGIVVADSSNHRVLGWRHVATFSNDQPADLVIGQPDFYSGRLNRTGGSPSANSLNTPRGVAFDSAGNLYIGDFNNSRVVEYTTPFSSCGSFPCVAGSANLIFGQPSATASSCDGLSTPSATTLCLPSQVAVDQLGNLYVADMGNNRVLEYNSPLTATTVPGSGDTTADLVIGQGATGTGAAFTTSNCNENSSALTANTMCNPLGVSVDPNNNLYISDSTNDRILEFNETVNATTAPANVSANAVFGQNNQLTKNLFIGRGANGLANPIGISFDDAGNMYAADEGNSRVIEYFTPMTVTATAGSGDTNADVLWGQGGDLESGACNAGAPSPAAATLCGSYSVANDSAGNVYITDTGNSRITAYAPPFPPPGADIGDNSPGVLNILPAAINFRATRVGQHRSRTATLVNAGQVPIKVGRLTAVGDFNVVEACPMQLAPGTRCDLRITFAPVTAGRRGGTISIGDDAHSSPHHIRLSGRADRRGAR